MKDPKGRTTIGFEKHIFICENSRIEGHPRGCCKGKGGSEIRLMFKNEIQKQKLAGKVRANKSGCLDVCEMGPAIVIYPLGVWYTNFELSDVDEIFEKSILNDNVVKRLVSNIKTWQKIDSIRRKDYIL